ncbi:MAG TPA: putative toxin-antitoxin system toxin component, PIN family [Chitinophagales bacterium]|nr:putative toxin-antitoxin system toxin component, PIN family [Chitinophagales bacterium]
MNYERVKNPLAFNPKVYLDIIEKVLKMIEINLRFDRVPDVNDNYLIDLAFAAKSYFIVTGDKQLRNLKQVNQIRIISIAEWRQFLKSVTRSL